MSWYDKLLGRKAFLLRHLGVRGTVKSYPGKALLLTLGIKKEAQILQASFHGSIMPGMAEFPPPTWYT